MKKKLFNKKRRCTRHFDCTENKICRCTLLDNAFFGDHDCPYYRPRSNLMEWLEIVLGGDRR